MKKWLLIVGMLLLASARSPAMGADGDWKVDLRYQIPTWQSTISLPDDWQKTLVGKLGELYYDYPGEVAGFQTQIIVSLKEPTPWVKQELLSPRVPIVRTFSANKNVDMLQEAFAVTPPKGEKTNDVKPRFDVLLVQLTNKSSEPAAVHPQILLESTQPLKADAKKKTFKIGGETTVTCSAPVEEDAPLQLYDLDTAKKKLVLKLSPVTIPANGKRSFCVWLQRKDGPHAELKTVADAEAARKNAETFWNSGLLPYDRIVVPDAGIQALIESSMRNIYQAREIKKGLPAFQVGPTCYRALWIVDGAFILEAATYFGCGAEVRPGIMYTLSHQRPDGGFTVLDKYWKESGIVLWTVMRHARLTGDKAWLESVWPKMEAAFNFIQKLRKDASKDPKAPYYGLIPPGFTDGGVAGIIPEYSNVYWSLVGMKSAIDAARWLGKNEEADAWQKQYDDFYAVFRKAVERDTQTDPHGNRYLPTRMLNEGKELPQRGQWAFCHAVFPGELFKPNDPLVTGNLAMLKATEVEGMVLGTGWAADGIWTYFASFYGHAWLWQGDGQKAARVLYDFANHAAPVLDWREEQMPQGKGNSVVGDMPHNWASAEFIRLVRHLLVLERGDELHLLEGMPPAWLAPGAVTQLKEMPTSFGPIDLRIQVSADGKQATVELTPPTRTPPKRIVLHLGGFGSHGANDAIDLPLNGKTVKTISLEDGQRVRQLRPRRKLGIGILPRDR